MTNQSTKQDANRVLDEGILRKYLAKLFDEVERILDKDSISKEERVRIQTSLAETVGVEILIRVGERFSDKEKEEFVTALEDASKGNQDKAHTVERLLNEKLTKEDKNRILAEATENVLKEFTEKIRG